ncbi:MAG: DUF342 domain-containing protein [Porcipelethomonas sp.]
MALDFFKKGLFKKNKGETDKGTDTEDAAEKTAEQEEKVQPETEAAAEPVQVKTAEQLESSIRERVDISVNSPLKLLWNIYNTDSDSGFSPVEKMFQPILETNKRLNELNENENSGYIEYDENQREFLNFTKRIQSLSAKFIRDIIQESVQGSFDDFFKGIDEAEFKSILSEVSEYGSIDEFRYACESGRKENRSKPMDAQVIMHVSADRLHAWIMVIPPLNKGSEIREEIISKQLRENSVIFGIDKSVISEIASGNGYFKIYEIARGTEVVHGKDGYVEDKFPRKNIINIREDENGNLNYKELNNIRSVHAGEVITEVFYPIEGTDGKRVDGKVINARSGTPPKIPKGRNTILKEEGKLLVAEKDGELVFKEGGFNVNELLTIEHDVDNASGNIDFAGDVLIKGDVREGFSVKAEGNITILGTAEGATIVSAGDITIKHGMTGGGKGVIRASGNLKCIFLENCYAYAKGVIEVDQVMYSEISSGDSIHISGKKGSVTGGKLIAGKSITADIIGAANNQYLKTDVVLGCTPEMIKKQANINHSLKEVSDKLFKVNQDINYIEENIDRMPEDRVAKLDQMKIQRKFMTLQKETLEKNLEQLTSEMEETAKACNLKCKTLNPIINFKVGENVYTLNKQLQSCHLFRKENSAVLCSSSLAENIVF